MAKVEIELSEFDAVRNARDKAENELKELKQSHKEEVDKLKEELKEAQKTQAEKILDAEEKLKEAQEVLKKLTNIPRKKWYEFWK